MEASESFSALRLGDGDLNWILKVRRGENPRTKDYKEGQATSVESHISTTGQSLTMANYDRLIRCYEQCDYLDWFEMANGDMLTGFELKRAPGTHRNPTPETSQLFYDWTLHELKGYLSRHRVLIAGAEAPLLRELYTDPRYRAVGKDYWPENAQVSFAGILNDGRYYWDHLDDVKDDLARQIRETKSDTLFLSLATGAKIICHELAREMNIRTYDFGSMARALAYAGSPGYHTARGSHSPFFFRVPLDVYMTAMEKAYPKLTLVELLGKAHAQLCLDLQDKIVGGSLSIKEADLSTMNPTPENLAAFKESHAWYREQMLPRVGNDAKAQNAVRDFTLWRRKRGLGLDGRIFATLARTKRMINSLLGRGAAPAKVIR